MACGGTIATKLQKFFKENQYGIKDIEELAEEGYIPSFVLSLGVDFLEFVENFYDNDANYTIEGLSKPGLECLKKYITEKYIPSYKL